ncbi:MAG: hypothetical protein C0485_12425 [Pirellula sp.]|nr:hypothetical protein [Pirellula sp.]
MKDGNCLNVIRVDSQWSSLSCLLLFVVKNPPSLALGKLPPVVWADILAIALSWGECMRCRDADSIPRSREPMKTTRSIRTMHSLAICALLITAVATGIFFASPACAANLTTLASFNYASGVHPSAGLIADSDGSLYGTALDGGGPNIYGTVFKVNPTTGALVTLASFNGANGQTTLGGLIADAHGNLYGTTRRGGANGYGTVFKIDSVTNALATLISFNGDNGGFSRAGLIADADGNLYGTTSVGGTSNDGTIFKLDPVTGILTTLASFDGVIGRDPRARLIADSVGNLYGTTYGAVGAVFKFNPVTNALTKLAQFDVHNGEQPSAGLIADADGNLYGTTAYGGASNGGTVFKLNPATGDLTTLVSFAGANGRIPFGDLIADANGNLYGTTSYGGASDLGTVFKLDLATGALTTLTSFNGVNGANPYAGLVADADGNLYSTTGFGGEFDAGTVFKLTDTGFVVPAVPEPMSLSLLALGGAAVVRRRRA